MRRPRAGATAAGAVAEPAAAPDAPGTLLTTSAIDAATFGHGLSSSH